MLYKQTRNISAHLSDSDLPVFNGFWSFFLLSVLHSVSVCLRCAVSTDLLSQSLVRTGCCCITYKIAFPLIQTSSKRVLQGHLL